VNRITERRKPTCYHFDADGFGEPGRHEATEVSSRGAAGMPATLLATADEVTE
jgi:hypothetical protein